MEPFDRKITVVFFKTWFPVSGMELISCMEPFDQWHWCGFFSGNKCRCQPPHTSDYMQMDSTQIGINKCQRKTKISFVGIHICIWILMSTFSECYLNVSTGVMHPHPDVCFPYPRHSFNHCLPSNQWIPLTSFPPLFLASFF